MPKELIPVRATDWITLGRMFDLASRCGYQTSFEFSKAMERRGVTFAVSAEALARYRRLTDAEKFVQMVEDEAEYGDKDHGLNIQIDQHSGEVWVREVPVEQMEAEQPFNISALVVR